MNGEDGTPSGLSSSSVLLQKNYIGKVSKVFVVFFC